MILTFTIGSLGLWLLTVSMLCVWYGLLVAVTFVAVCLAGILTAVVCAVIYLRGLVFRQRKSEAEI